MFYQILSLIVAPVLVGIVTELFSHWLERRTKTTIESKLLPNPQR
ncbi:type I toxin-antitoxin system Fst family toxin [Enterococcus faecium]|nr:type I toxin-antitoxin system Fst family toxin [Enterococcus faecium]